MAISSTQLQQLYVGYLGRAADQAGLDYWLAELNANPPVMTLETLRSNFVNEQPEYAAVYGNLTREQQITRIYENLFERAPDAEGLAYWVSGGGAAVNADQLIVAFIDGAAADDHQVLINKVFVAETYTAVAGSDFNSSAATAVIAEVDGSTASVTDALTAIADSHLPGQVPGLNLILAEQQANASLAAYEAQITEQTAGDDTPITDAASAQSALEAATAARTTVSADSTSVLTTRLADADAAVSTAAANVDPAILSAYQNATAAVDAIDEPAIDAAEASSIAGFSTATSAGTLSALLAEHAPTGTTAQDLYNAYVAGDEAARAAIAEDVNPLSFGPELLAVGDRRVAYNDAVEAETTATNNLTAAPGGSAYLDAVTAHDTAAATLADAQAADAEVAEVQAIVDQFDTLTSAATNAATAVDTFSTQNTTANLIDLAADATATAENDVFYFADEILATDDFSIGGFADGDHLVVGTGLMFNSGALSTGSGTTKEFFLTQSGADTQVFIELTEFGSATTADDEAVVTLVGVNSADLAVNNGVISFA